MGKPNRGKKNSSPIPPASTVTEPAASTTSVVTGGIDLQGINPKFLKSVPINKVELDALVVLKIIKHSKESHPIPVNGQLLGLDLVGALQVTNSFPSTATSEEELEMNQDGLEDYQLSMLRSLRKLNFDANVVGWYQSTFLGSFWNQQFIETCYAYQKNLDSSIVLVFDPTSSLLGNLNLKAFRLSDKFMNLFKEKKFNLENIEKYGVLASEILEPLPIYVKNSHLLNAWLSKTDIPTVPTSSPTLDFKHKFTAAASPMEPNFNSLELGFDHYLEKHLEYLGDTIEEHSQEQWRLHGWQRNYQKELSKVLSRGEEEKNHPALVRLLQNEPSRLETMMIMNQIDTYCEQVHQFAGPGLSKMFVTKALQ